MADLVKEQGQLRYEVLTVLHKALYPDSYAGVDPYGIEVDQFTVERTTERKGYRSTTSFTAPNKSYPDDPKVKVCIAIEIPYEAMTELPDLTRRLAEFESRVAKAAAEKRFAEARAELEAAQVRYEAAEAAMQGGSNG